LIISHVLLLIAYIC